MKLVASTILECRHVVRDLPMGGWMLSIVRNPESMEENRWLYHHGRCGWWMLSEMCDVEECLRAEQNNVERRSLTHRDADQLMFIDNESLYSLTKGDVDALLMAFRLMGEDAADKWFIGGCHTILKVPDHEL